MDQYGCVSRLDLRDARLDVAATDRAKCADIVRDVKPAPNAKRMTGPKLTAVMGPAK